jgi:hypothetical protein
LGHITIVPQQKTAPSEDVAIVPVDLGFRLALREFNRDLRTAKILGHCDLHSALEE